VIVVYKVDRLTRSLADFAKLVELFDKHSVSFVSGSRLLWKRALMLDNPEKTARLLAALKAAVPFKVELVPSLVTYLRAHMLPSQIRPSTSSRTRRMPATKVASCAYCSSG
jgi:Resolvase, N terminal domain